MKKLLKIAFAASVLAATIGMTSCATASAYIQTNGQLIEQNLELKRPFFPIFSRYSTSCSWGNYSVEFGRVKDYGSSFTIFGFGKGNRSKSTEGYFCRNGEPLFKTGVYLTEESFLNEAMFKSDVAYIRKNVVMVTGRNGTVIPLFNEVNDIILKNDDVVSIEITKVHDTMQDGNKYTLWMQAVSGLEVKVKGQTYALIDVIAAKPKLYLNDGFAETLTEDEESFVASVILGTFAYYYDFYSELDTTGEEISISDRES